jgi:putative acetyltransferase
MLSIRPVGDEPGEVSLVRELFMEYAEGLNENLCFQGFEDELKNPQKKYSEPSGCLLLAYWDEKPAGCIALQPLGREVCEMKRLYVRKQYRKLGIGDSLVEVLLDEARTRGYKKMVLDTLGRLIPAIKLYTKFGFQDTTAYYDNPLKDVVFMEKML